MSHKQQHHSNTFNKYSLIIGIVAIASIAIAGFSYFGGNSRKDNSGIISTRSSNGGSCPMMRNINTANSTSAGGCGMMNKSVKTIQELSPSPQAAKADQTETITMNYNEEGALSPSVINLQIGKTYKIIININTDVYGCMSSMAIPGLTNDIYDIQKGTSVTFNITPNKAGTYEFTCAMGVPQGAKIIVQ